MEIDEKVVLKYEGGQTDLHVIDAIRFGESMQGVGKLYSSVAHFWMSGEELQPRKQPIVRVVAGESGSGCYELGVLFNSIGAHQDLFLSGNIEVYKWLVAKVVSFVQDDATGRGDAEQTASEIMDKANSDSRVAEILAQGSVDTNHKLIDQLDRFAQMCGPALAMAVAPVGRDCKELNQFSNTHYSVKTTVADADAIRSSQDFIVGDSAEYECTQITSLDVNTGSCKLLIKDIEGTVSGKISDPVIEAPHNVYSKALDLRTGLIVVAKPHLQNNEIKKLYISDARSLIDG